MKAGAFCRNFDSASIPSFEPRIEGMAMLLDTFSSMSRCCANLGHSLRMCSLVSNVSLSFYSISSALLTLLVLHYSYNFRYHNKF